MQIGREVPASLSDPQTGEFSNVGRTGWDWRCTLWVVVMVIVGYGSCALVALAIKAIWGG